MAKVQSFADKAKGKKKVEGVTVKVIKSMKADSGAYKFNEKIVKLTDISSIPVDNDSFLRSNQTIQDLELLPGEGVFVLSSNLRHIQSAFH